MVSFRSLALLALAGLSVASPLKVREDSLEVRQEGINPAEIIEVADEVINLIKDVFDFIHDIDDRQHAAEANFTQSMVGTLAAKYPNKNVILFHNQKCKTNFVNAVHEHYEFNIGLGMTQGYEAFIFDSGSFDLVGDGGYINWCFQGNWNRKGNHVDFATIGSATPTKRDTTVPKLTFDFTAKHNTTNGKTTTHKPLHAPVTYQPAPAPQKPLLPPMHPKNTKTGSNDGHHFVQCKAKGNDTVSQGIAYYKNLVPGKNAGQKPDAFTWLSKVHGGNSTKKADDKKPVEKKPTDTKTTDKKTTDKKTANKRAADKSAHEDWTLPVGAVDFSTIQTSVHWQIFGNAIAETVKVDETCGVADNGKEHFWVYKSHGEQLFEMENFACDSLYYAF